MTATEQSIMEHVAGLDQSQGAISPNTRLLEAGLLDSINLVQLIQFLEESFGITIPDTDLGPELFESVATIAAYVDRRKS